MRSSDGPRPKHILIIDDDPVAGAIYRSIFELDGFRVSVAAAGGEGLSIIDARAPDLVVLDLLMPVMDGWEVLSRLREHTASLPVVVSSAALDSTRAVRAGATAWHSKSSSLSELREICRGLLDGPRHRDRDAVRG